MRSASFVVFQKKNKMSVRMHVNRRWKWNGYFDSAHASSQSILAHFILISNTRWLGMWCLGACYDPYYAMRYCEPIIFTDAWQRHCTVPYMIRYPKTIILLNLSPFPLCIFSNPVKCLQTRRHHQSEALRGKSSGEKHQVKRCGSAANKQYIRAVEGSWREILAHGRYFSRQCLKRMWC